MCGSVCLEIESPDRHVSPSSVSSERITQQLHTKLSLLIQHDWVFLFVLFFVVFFSHPPFSLVYLLLIVSYLVQ